MAKSDSPLVIAATEFDEVLAVYSRLGELLLKTPLTTLKHLERANQTLGELADSEQKLQDAGKKLIEALSAARQKQEQLSQAVIAHAPTLQARNTRLRELMNEMGALAQDVAGINTLVAAKNGDEQQEPDTGEVSAKVLELSERAAQLATTARDAEFPELDEQAHALHQRLKSVGQKLQKAGGN